MHAALHVPATLPVLAPPTRFFFPPYALAPCPAQAIQAYRIANFMWRKGRRDVAHDIQGRAATVFNGGRLLRLCACFASDPLRLIFSMPCLPARPRRSCMLLASLRRAALNPVAEATDGAAIANPDLLQWTSTPRPSWGVGCCWIMPQAS